MRRRSGSARRTPHKDLLSWVQLARLAEGVPVLHRRAHAPQVGGRHLRVRECKLGALAEVAATPSDLDEQLGLPAPPLVDAQKLRQAVDAPAQVHQAVPRAREHHPRAARRQPLRVVGVKGRVAWQSAAPPHRARVPSEDAAVHLALVRQLDGRARERAPVAQSQLAHAPSVHGGVSTTRES